MQKARVGPSYNCCLQAYAIAVFFFYDAASEKPRFTCEVEAGDIRGIDVENLHVPIYMYPYGILLEQIGCCGFARVTEKHERCMQCLRTLES